MSAARKKKKAQSAKKGSKDDEAKVAIDLDDLHGGVDEQLLANIIAGQVSANLVGGYERNAATSLDELFKAQELRDEGVWLKWPALRGSEIRIASIEHAQKRLNELNNEYREEQDLPKSAPVPYEVREHLFRKAVFGTSILGWRWVDPEDPESVHESNLPMGGGKWLAFTQENCERLMAVKDFEEWFGRTAASKTVWRQRAAQEMAGN